MDKKFVEMEEEVDKLIEDNDVEPGSLGQRIEFDNSVFSDKDQVDDFLRAHVFTDASIDETKKGFEVILFDEIAFIDSTIRKIKIRDGVTIYVGLLRPMSAENPLLFNLKEGDSLKLSADIPYVIELATVVDGFHAAYGEVKITKKNLISFKENFENKVVGVDLSIDFDHETREAAGWIKEVFLSDDGDTLFGVIKWTPKGAVSLTDREFRYLSPEFHPNWVHPHTRKEYGPTLLGAALVNRPFLKMDAIVGLNESKNKGVPKMEKTIALADHNQKVVDLQKDIDALKLSEGTAVTTAKNLQGKVETLTKENTELKLSAEKKEKEDKHNVLFSEGKINKAQLTALNEGKTLLDVLSLNDKLNTTPAGSNEADNKVVKLSDAEKAMAKKMDLTEEEFHAANYEEAK